MSDGCHGFEVGVEFREDGERHLDGYLLNINKYKRHSRVICYWMGRFTKKHLGGGIKIRMVQQIRWMLDGRMSSGCGRLKSINNMFISIVI